MIIRAVLLVLSSFFFWVATAHEHDDDMDHVIDTSEPIDVILKLHIMLQIFTWGIMFPAGAVLGLAKSKLHVPVQVAATAITTFGFLLGHLHGGRRFRSSGHSAASTYMALYLGAQVACGVALKTHIGEGTKTRAVIKFIHGLLGRIFPVVAWAQICLGGIAMLGFCSSEGDHVGQCFAHFFMGSSFIIYGILMLIMLRYGAGALKRSGWSQEFIDCSVITAWGLFNSVTEHGLFFSKGWTWSHGDFQHTTLGVVWASMGAVGVYLSRGGRRTFVPGFILIVTGWAMGTHEQHTMMSTMVHQAFGYSLMAAGVGKIIEVCFVLGDNPSPAEEERQRSIQHFTPYLLCISGMLFLSATEEQLVLMTAIGMDHISYVLVIISFASVIYLYANLLVHLYNAHAPSMRGANGTLSKANGYHDNYHQQSFWGRLTTALSPVDEYYELHHGGDGAGEEEMNGLTESKLQTSRSRVSTKVKEDV